GFCASIATRSAWIARSPSMIARTLPTSSIWCGTISGYRKPKSAFQPRILASRSTRELSMPKPPWLRLAKNFPWCAEWEGELKRLFANYVEAKQRQNVLDYDDLLLYWAQMVQEGEIAGDVCSRFDHVFVDEYQDTNGLQASILLAL